MNGVETLPVLAPNQRLSPAERARLAAHLGARYQAGASIRELCSQTGYSIGRVRGLLRDADITFRSRGGLVGIPRPRRAT